MSGGLLQTVPPGDAPELSARDLEYVQQFIKSKTAVELAGKEYLIESRLAPVVRDHSLRNLAELVRELRAGTNRELVADVRDAMTTNETSFFRDQHPFEILADTVIPELLEATAGRGPLTIWNGAASSGQESLSLAMVVNEKFPDLAKAGRTRIIETDVSATMVRRAKDATYSRFEINRGLSTTLAMKYFKQQGRNWVANKELRDLIETHELNLIERWPAVPRCDLVMLRNVLIYFDVPTKRDILRRIRTDVLKPNGTLILGSSESTMGLDDQFVSQRVGNSTRFVMKESAR